MTELWYETDPQLLACELLTGARFLTFFVTFLTFQIGRGAAAANQDLAERVCGTQGLDGLLEKALEALIASEIKVTPCFGGNLSELVEVPSARRLG